MSEHLLGSAREVSEGSASPLARAIAWIGLALGPIAFGLVEWLVPVGTGDGALSDGGRAVLALAAWMAIWWITEAVPLAATALLPMLILPLLGVGTARQAMAPYADEIIFLFLGGFVLGLALQRVGLHARLALRTLLVVGTTPNRMIGGIMLATAGLSMFVSNSATAMMMTPLALSIVALVATGGSPDDGGRAKGWSPTAVRHFGIAMLLGVGYAATIGGMGTIIGTPPNAVMTGYAERNLGIQIGFGQWMMLAMPAVILLLPMLWAMLVFVLHPVRVPGGIEGGRDFIRSRLDALGPISRAEWMVGIIFGLTALLWIFRQPLAEQVGLVNRDAAGKVTGYLVTDAMIAIFGALLLLVVPMLVRSTPGGLRQPVLTWEQAERLPWGILLMFGGGLSLAWAIGHTKLDAFLAVQLQGLGGFPPWLIIACIVVGVVAFSELAGNTAVAQIVMPILAALAVALKLDPILVLMAATLAASCGFALPVATPPNAIVFATGRIGMGPMVRAGLLLDLLSAAVIVGVICLLGPTLKSLAGL